MDKAKQPLRVALFTETFLPKLDGVVTITCLTLEHLRRIGAEVIIFAAGARVSEYAGYPVVSMRGIPAFFYPDLELALPSPRVRQMLVDFDPHVIHVINPVMSGLGGMVLARNLKKPLIASFHTHLMEMAKFYGMGIFEELLWALHRLAYRRADLVLATSERVVAQLRAQNFGEVGLWRRGVDVSRFSPQFATEHMRCRLTSNHPDRVVLLSAGRLAPEKQIEQLVPVMQALEGFNVHLAIVGDGPQRPALEAAFKGYPVTFLGMLKGAELSEAYASADIFAFPSSSIETFGLVVAEAMASGLAVVASDVGGVRELIQHGENGFIFAENDTVTLSEHVRTLVEDAYLRQRFATHGRESVLNRTWTHIMDELFVHYTHLAEHGTNPALAPSVGSRRNVMETLGS